MTSARLMLACALLANLTSAGNTFAQETIRVPQVSPRSLLLDGRIDPGEWDGAVAVTVAGPIRLRLLQSGGDLFIAVLTGGGPPRPVDIYLEESTGRILQLHASAAIGERLLADTLWTDTAPAWRWGNHVGWMANEAKVDSHQPTDLPLGARMFPAEAVEFQIRPARLPGASWRMRVEVGRFPGTEGHFVFPRGASRDPGSWAIIETGPATAADSVFIDLTAVDRFWAVYDALRSDAEPTTAEWDALFATPAWRTLGPWRQGRARERYALAFRPSRDSARVAVRAKRDYESQVLRHLESVIEHEAALRQLATTWTAAPTRLGLAASAQRARQLLPAEAPSPGKPLGVAFAIFEPDGYADGMVVIDLRHALSLDARLPDVTAHEMHHVLQARLIRPFRRPANGSADQWLLESLFQLQREGVADLLDKGTVSRTGEVPADALHLAGFGADVARSVEVLASLSQHLESLPSASPGESVAIARAIRWEVLPNSGHPTGYFMARTILESRGREALTGALRNPFDFVRTYQAAAAAAGGPVLSASAIVVLEALEARTFGAAPSAGGEAAQP